MISKFKQAGIILDFSCSNFSEDYCNQNSEKISKALVDLERIEAGEIMNPSENRMVGHYWLRDTEVAPNKEILEEITSTLNDIKDFVQDSDNQAKFKNILVVGIGGSALGPQFIARALKFKAKRRIFFFDNTDPEGFEDVLSEVGDLSETLTIVISKSGSTPETYNGMKVAEYAYSEAGLKFGEFAVAITMPGSKLDQIATDNNWLKSFSMLDWVGGRTSIWSSVGILPLSLLGIDIDQLLTGAKDLDLLGRNNNLLENPSLQLALFWLQQTNARAEKNMIVLPYSDRLELFGKYLQQLIMESLGKEKDLDGNIVNQGITVLGNKGSTDQHSYIQQLREGPNDYFAIFVKALETSSKYNIKVKDDYTTFDYLNGFFLGTRKALFENGRESLSIVIPRVDEYYIGALIALFERAVSFYASFTNINAYDQPGVEAGKKAAIEFLERKEDLEKIITNCKH